MKLFSILLIFISPQLFAKELILDCESGYSFKILYPDKSNKAPYFKFKDNGWIEVKKYKFKEDSIELFITDNKYLACADASLPVCNYGILISKISKARPVTYEVVMNDCYIGTMGCNEYKRGLKLNKSFCKKF